jgi:hypothetical protein
VKERNLSVENLNFQRLYEAVAAEYARGRTEADIDWNKIVIDCIEERSPVDQRHREVYSGARRVGACGLATAVIIGVVAFAWIRETFIARNYVPKSEKELPLRQNAALKKETKQLTASRKPAQQQLTSKPTRFEQEVARLRKKPTTQRTAPSAPSASSGIVTRKKRERNMMAMLRSESAEQSRGAQGEDHVVPLSPENGELSVSGDEYLLLRQNVALMFKDNEEML